MTNTVLTKKDAVKAILLQEKLSSDYLPYFKNLSESEFVFDAQNRNIIVSTLAKIKRANTLIARVFLGVGVTNSTKRELDNLNQILSEIDGAYNTLSDRAQEYDGLKVALENTTDLTAISPKDLSLSIKLSRKQQRAYSKKDAPQRSSGFGSGGFLSGIPGAVAHSFGITGGKSLIAAGVASQIGAAVLGPYAGIGLPAALAGMHMGMSGIKGGSRLGMWAAKKGVKGLGYLGRKFGPGTLDKIGGYDRPLDGFNASQTETPLAQIAGDWTTQPRDARGRWTTGKKSKKELKDASDPIYHFFDKRAGKAKWTKDVLRTLKSINKGGGGRGGKGGLPGSFSGGAVGAAIGGSLLKWLGKKSLAIGVITAGTIYATYLISKTRKEVGKSVEDTKATLRGTKERVASLPPGPVKTALEKEQKSLEAETRILEEAGETWYGIPALGFDLLGKKVIKEAKSNWFMRWLRNRGPIRPISPSLRKGRDGNWEWTTKPRGRGYPITRSPEDMSAFIEESAKKVMGEIGMTPIKRNQKSSEDVFDSIKQRETNEGITNAAAKVIEELMKTNQILEEKLKPPIEAEQNIMLDNNTISPELQLLLR